MGLASAWRVSPRQCTSCMGELRGKRGPRALLRGGVDPAPNIPSCEGCSVPKPVDISLVQVIPSTLAQGSFQEVLSGTPHTVSWSARRQECGGGILGL